MKKNSITSVIILTLISVFTFAEAQKLKVKEIELPVSKEARKKGTYITTTLTREGNIRTFIVYDLKKDKLGLDILSIDPSGNIVDNASEEANAATAQKYEIEIPEPGSMPDPSKGVQVLRLVTSTGILGKLKIQEGHFEPKYAKGTEYGELFTNRYYVIKGYKFQSDQESESDMRLNIYAAHCEEGADLEKSYAILEGLIANTVGYFDKNATIAFIGKDARVDKDSPNAQNVVISGQFEGKTKSFKNIREHVLEYNQAPVTDGYDGHGHRSVLVSTLNAPSTISAHKKFQAKGTPYMTYLTMDKKGSVIDNVTFQSKSVRGNFGIYGFGDDHYVLGSINDGHSGYYRFDVGKPSHFQIVKISNGQVVVQELFSMDDMEAMLVTPGGKKGKLKYKDIEFKKCLEAPNGDLLAFAQAQKEYLIFQFNKEGKMNAVYSIERVPGNGYAIGVLESNGDLFVMYREQSGAISQGVKKTVSRGAGYMKNTNVTRVDELMTYARIVKINPEEKTCTVQLDFLDDVVMGEDVMFSGASGELILPVRDKKKNYKMVMIQ